MWKLKFAARLAIAAMIVGTAVLAINERTAVAGVSATLAIDADPSGTPCSPVNASRVVSPGDSVSVALCVLNSAGEPISGGITNFAANVSYTSPLAATNNAGNSATGQGGNPLWNQGGLGGTGIWDCNVLDNAASAPKASPSPAQITCATNSLSNQSIPGTAYLALLTFTPPVSPGTSDITWNSSTNVLSGFTEAFCGSEITCADAQITVSGTGPTATPVGPTNTPTQTAEPCNVDGATCTPVLQDRNTVTPTPTLATATVPPGAETPVPGAPTTPGETPPTGGQAPGGGPGGVITPPDTGSGGDAGGGRDNTLVIGLLTLIVGGSVAAGLRVASRAVHERSRN